MVARSDDQALVHSLEEQQRSFVPFGHSDLSHVLLRSLTSAYLKIDTEERVNVPNPTLSLSDSVYGARLDPSSPPLALCVPMKHRELPNKN